MTDASVGWLAALVVALVITAAIALWSMNAVPKDGMRVITLSDEERLSLHIRREARLRTNAAARAIPENPEEARRKRRVKRGAKASGVSSAAADRTS